MDKEQEAKDIHNRIMTLAIMALNHPEPLTMDAIAKQSGIDPYAVATYVTHYIRCGDIEVDHNGCFVITVHGISKADKLADLIEEYTK